MSKKKERERKRRKRKLTLAAAWRKARNNKLSGKVAQQ